MLNDEEENENHQGGRIIGVGMSTSSEMGFYVGASPTNINYSSSSPQQLLVDHDGGGDDELKPLNSNNNNMDHVASTLSQALLRSAAATDEKLLIRDAQQDYVSSSLYFPPFFSLNTPTTTAPPPPLPNYNHNHNHNHNHNPWAWATSEAIKEFQIGAGRRNYCGSNSGGGGGGEDSYIHSLIGGRGVSVSAMRMKMKMKKIKARRKVREPRFCFKTMSDVDVLDDGYKWRKYGQKVVKNTLHPRSYYRCTQEKCRVKKRVERLAEDPRMVITTYEGRHIHSPSEDLDNSQTSQPYLNNFFW